MYELNNSRIIFRYVMQISLEDSNINFWTVIIMTRTYLMKLLYTNGTIILC